MDLYDVMRTTSAVREFTDDPRPDSVLHQIIDSARFAPSGGNRQGAHIDVIRDGTVRQRLAALNVPGAHAVAARFDGAPFHLRGCTTHGPPQSTAEHRRAPQSTAEHRERMPR